MFRVKNLTDSTRFIFDRKPCVVCIHRCLLNRLLETITIIESASNTIIDINFKKITGNIYKWNF